MNKTISKKKIFIIIGSIVILLIGLAFLPSALSSLNKKKFQDEIQRVADTSGIRPESINCQNVEFANICYATYTSLSIQDAQNMLTKAGYTTQKGSTTSVSATNTSKSTRVDTDKSSPKPNKLVLKYKDINTTL